MIRINTDSDSFKEARKFHSDGLRDKIVAKIKAYTDLFTHFKNSSAKNFSLKRSDAHLLIGEREKVKFSKHLRKVYKSATGKSTLKLYLDLLELLETRIDEVLIGEPAVLELVISDIQTASNGFDTAKISNSGLPKWNDSYVPFIIAANDIFDYTEFSKKSQIWGAYNLADKHKIDVCPYCNRLYTITVIQEVKYETPKRKIKRVRYENIVRPEFDHFYCKSWYPYLALSFYNLVPSCHVCNSNLKGGQILSIKTYIHPYVEGFENDIKFSTGISANDYINAGYKVNAAIAITKATTIHPDKADRSEKNIELFALREIYKWHKDTAEDIFRSAIFYTKPVLTAFLNIGRDNSKLFDDDFDLYRLVLKNFYGAEAHHRRPLAKFTEDIATETGIIDVIKELEGKINPV